MCAHKVNTIEKAQITPINWSVNPRAFAAMSISQTSHVFSPNWKSYISENYVFISEKYGLSQSIGKSQRAWTFKRWVSPNLHAGDQEQNRSTCFSEFGKTYFIKLIFNSHCLSLWYLTDAIWNKLTESLATSLGSKMNRKSNFSIHHSITEHLSIYRPLVASHSLNAALHCSLKRSFVPLHHALSCPRCLSCNHSVLVGSPSRSQTPTSPINFPCKMLQCLLCGQRTSVSETWCSFWELFSLLSKNVIFFTVFL